MARSLAPGYRFLGVKRVWVRAGVKLLPAALPAGSRPCFRTTLRLPLGQL
jgi:hypothetical protein